MTEVSAVVPFSARARCTSASVNPPSASAPARRNSRRSTGPRQNGAGIRTPGNQRRRVEQTQVGGVDYHGLKVVYHALWAGNSRNRYACACQTRISPLPGTELSPV